jgi:hypothetical protein
VILRNPFHPVANMQLLETPESILRWNHFSWLSPQALDFS